MLAMSLRLLKHENINVIRLALKPLQYLAHLNKYRLNSLSHYPNLPIYDSKSLFTILNNERNNSMLSTSRQICFHQLEACVIGAL
jgi:hypothetical protein